MKTATTLIHAVSLSICFSAYLAMNDDAGLSGMRRAMQTIAAAADAPALPAPATIAARAA